MPLQCTRASYHPLAKFVPDTIAFGLKRGVGLATQVGCSPSALRRVMAMLEAAVLETTAAWERKGVAAGEMREMIGAVDETFLQRMM